MLPPPQPSLSRSRKGSAQEPDHSSGTSRTLDNLFLFYKQMYLFYFSICFFLESLNSVVKVHNWQGETRTERQFSTQSPLKSQGDTAVSLTASHTNAAPLISCYQAHTWWQLQPQHPTFRFRNWWSNLWDLCKKELRWQRQPADKKDAS